MAGSALATSAVCQSADAHHPGGMRRDRALPATSSGLLLLCIFFVLLRQAHSTPNSLPPAPTSQLYIVCKNQKTNTCVTWLIGLENEEELTNELSPFHHQHNHQHQPSQICGLSDLIPIPPHRKFIALIPLGGSEHSKIFCKSVNVVADDASLAELPGPFKSLYRARRQAGYNLRGRYRGQTQSQYLAIDGGKGKDEGKAEAHSAADSSRASVSGNSGMGQAQSQTIYDPSCEECYGAHSGMDASNLRRPEQGNYGFGHGGIGEPGANQGGNGGLGMPSHDNTGQGIPGQGGIGGQGMQNQGGMGGQRIPGQGSMGGQRIPGQGGTGGQGIPGQGGMSGQRIPGHSGNGGQGVPGQGGIGGQGIPGQVGMGGQGIPGQRGIAGQGIPGQGGIGGQVIPGQVGTGGQGIPGQRGIAGQSLPGQVGVSGQGIPGQGGIGGQVIPGQIGMGGQGIPGQRGIAGQSLPGQVGVGGQGIPGQGGIAGQGIPGQVGMGGQGLPGQSGIAGQGKPGQGGIGGHGIPGQSGIVDQGIPGQGGIAGQGIPGQGIGGYGVPGQGGQGITGQGGISGQGTLGQGGIGGQGLPGQGVTGGQGIPRQPGPGGLGIPGQRGINGQETPGQRGIGGQGIPSQGGTGRHGMPDQGTIAGQGIPTQGDIRNQGIQGQIGLPGIPSLNGMGGVTMPSNGGPTGITGGFPSIDNSNKWPLTSGPIRGADGLIYYCCVVNPGQGYYPDQISRTNLIDGQQAPGGNYGTGGLPQITGGNGPQTQYGHDGQVNARYPYGSGGDGQPSLHGVYGQAPQLPGETVQQPNYGNGLPGPPNTYGSGGTVVPGQYGQTGGPPSTGGTGQQNTYGNNGNALPSHPYQYGQGAVGQPSQNRQYGQSVVPYEQAGNGQGPDYTYGPGGNSGGIYGQSGVPQGTDQHNEYGQRPQTQNGPDYTYNSVGTVQPNMSGGNGQIVDSQNPYVSRGQLGPDETYRPNSGGQQITYAQGGNAQQTPGYNYGSGSTGQPIYGGTGSQGPYGSNGNGQQRPNYSYGSGATDQASPSGINGQGRGSVVPGGPGQEGMSQHVPAYNYGQGSTDQATPDGTYGQTGRQPQIAGQQGSDSSYGTGGSSPIDMYGQSGNNGLQHSYQNGGNGQQGYIPEYSGGGQGQQTVGGYVPGTSQGNGQKTDIVGEPQNVMDPNSITGENDDSQALASVYQGANGTTASASSQGGNEKGHAQTNVQGTYSDSGSFSAQASISDENKGAESQVSGSKKGATSNAEGRGRKNKSQAAVKLGSETGSIQTESQSGGNMHSSNTQVQGSVKGGVADAQARGPGSTSSQAQIGFTPYKEGDKAHEIIKTPFEGGGTASAQTSGRMGTSQSQLRGTFKYGITYNGAAQAGASLDKDAVFSSFTPFEKIDVFDQNNTNIDVNADNTDKPISIDLDPETSTSYEGLQKNQENTIQDSNVNYNGHSHYDHHKSNDETNATSVLPLPGNRRAFSSTYGNNNGGDYDYNVDDPPTDEYDVEEVPEGADNIQNEFTNYDNYGREAENTHQSQRQYSASRKGLEVRQTTGGSTQHILIGSLKNQDAKITQIKSERPDESKIYQPGERVPGMGGYTIPIGFTGSVKSVSSKEKTYVVGTKHSPSQAQTVTLTPGTGKVKYAYPERYGSNNINPKDLRSLYNPRADDDRYVSVSKSVTRDLDSENNIRKQYSHTYYTKSSSCGYFTFTCTMVSSAEGKKKVCRPKIPTNADGTPMRC